MDTQRTTPPKRRRGWRIVGWSALGLVGLLVLGVVGLMVFKPWAPRFVTTDPGPGGTRVTEAGVLGNYYPAAGSADAPAVLVLGGSEGGIDAWVDEQARALAGAGYHALALSYFGGPGQDHALHRVPLETFDAALDWLRGRPGVDGSRLAVLGTSKGGEAALLVGTRHPELNAVVANVPSTVAWQGLNLVEPWTMGSLGSSWTAGGVDVPFLRFPAAPPQGDLIHTHQAGLDTLDQHGDARIDVGRIAGALLLVCGEADTMWPSCPMSRDVQARATGAATVELLAYPDAGHAASGVPAPVGEPLYGPLDALGGTPETNAAAREQSWSRTLTFLRDAFGS